MNSENIKLMSFGPRGAKIFTTIFIFIFVSLSIISAFFPSIFISMSEGIIKIAPRPNIIELSAQSNKELISNMYGEMNSVSFYNFQVLMFLIFVILSFTWLVIYIYLFRNEDKFRNLSILTISMNFALSVLGFWWLFINMDYYQIHDGRAPDVMRFPFGNTVFALGVVGCSQVFSWSISAFFLRNMNRN